MKLSDFTIESLKEIISGDCGYTPGLSGPNIIKFFNQVGVRDVYSFQDGGMPERLSRNQYVAKKLKDLNGTKQLVILLENLVDSRHFAASNDLDRNLAVQRINEIIVNDGYVFHDIENVWKITGQDLPEDIEIEIHFEEIQAQIIEQIKSAKFSIWIAVAWFTDKVLMREIYNKKNEGLNIRLVVFDDEINRNHGFEYEKYFETKRVEPIGIYKNIMHHKFCIIDFKTVIHGSYNWTNKARWNKETISIDSGREIAEKFGNEFINLIK
jgi:hypothetical protein